MRRLALCRLCWAAVLALPNPARATSPCDALLAQLASWSPAAAATRKVPAGNTSATGAVVAPETLVELTDIGPVYRAGVAPVMTLSPDGRAAAFQLVRADVGTDAYCAAMVVLPLDGLSAPQVLDMTRAVWRDESPAFGWASFPSGVAATVTPRWRADGEEIAYLRRTDDGQQLWTADRAGHLRQMTREAGTVDDFRYSADGRRLVYAVQTPAPSADAPPDAGPDAGPNAGQAEDRRGWHYDARMLPLRGIAPRAARILPAYRAIDLATGQNGEAMAQDRALFEVDEAAAPVRSARGDTVQRLAGVPDAHLSVVRSDGEELRCGVEVCQPLAGFPVWWSEDGTQVLFFTRGGWADSLTQVRAWQPSATTTRLVFETPDLLLDCQPRDGALFCLREASRHPRHVVRIAPESGESRTLFDPNPAFAAHSLGAVERRTWRNAQGVAFFGDLVYPAGYRPGHRYPLVVVQYRTRGFLRGGVGNEVPIQTLAGRGSFVLVLDIRDEAAAVPEAASPSARQQAYYGEHRGFLAITSALERITQQLVAEGKVDPARIGLSGLSAGSGTVQFAALNTQLFAAGSVSGCCWEPIQDLWLGPAITEVYHAGGWPRLIDDCRAFWDRLSLMRAPTHVQFPLLFQMSDSEVLAALGSYTALRQADRPADLYIFPDEFHLKWHPAHMLAAYRRNLAWFEFWLSDRWPDDSPARAEAERWAAMRERARSNPPAPLAPATSGGPTPRCRAAP